MDRSDIMTTAAVIQQVPVAAAVEESAENKIVLYRTSDIYFAAFLCAIDIPLITTETEKSDNKMHKKMVFVFKAQVKDVPRFKSLYFGGRATVNVQRFVQGLRNLKSMCFV